MSPASGRGGPTSHHDCTGEEGASLVTSVFGVGIFLTFLLVVVQVVLFLFTASVVQAAAVDGASHGAGAAQAADHVLAAESHAAQVLGRLADDAEIEPAVVNDPSGAVLHVRIRVQLPSVLGAVGLASVERAAEARIEQ